MDSDEVRQTWADRTGEYSPAYYAYYGPDETSERLRRVLAERVGRSGAVLELGCSSGRHLAALHEDGFTDLAGVEVNEDAFAVMADQYPDLHDAGTFFADALEAVLPEFPEDRFDAIYSVETMQHVHPDADWVFAEVARVAADVVVTVEHEGTPEDRGTADPGVNYVHDDVPLYYRDWHAIFTDLGMVEVESWTERRDTGRVFAHSP
ncbi:MAG: class I SAM-dependent methyltransferase [Halanaeroarchaeum sp.]